MNIYRPTVLLPSFIPSLTVADYGYRPTVPALYIGREQGR
jgi:hypothetical protein